MERAHPGRGGREARHPTGAALSLRAGPGPDPRGPRRRLRRPLQGPGRRAARAQGAEWRTVSFTTGASCAGSRKQEPLKRPKRTLLATIHTYLASLESRSYVLSSWEQLSSARPRFSWVKPSTRLYSRSSTSIGPGIADGKRPSLYCSTALSSSSSRQRSDIEAGRSESHAQPRPSALTAACGKP